MSFSPLDIAMAFDTPLLRGLHPQSARRVAEHRAGASRVQYGILRDGHSMEKMVISDVRQVRAVKVESMTVKEHYESFISNFWRLTRMRSSLRSRSATDSNEV